MKCVKKIDGCECYPVHSIVSHDAADDPIPEWVKACIDLS